MAHKFFTIDELDEMLIKEPRSSARHANSGTSQ